MSLAWRAVRDGICAANDESGEADIAYCDVGVRCTTYVCTIHIMTEICFFVSHNFGLGS